VAATDEPAKFKRQWSCDVSCVAIYANFNDIDTAESALADWFGGGNTFYGSVVSLYNGVYAFGCD
jgi:hypothetical protein